MARARVERLVGVKGRGRGRVRVRGYYAKRRGPAKEAVATVVGRQGGGEGRGEGGGDGPYKG